MENILTLSNVDKKFYTEIGELEVLKNISFEIKKGEIIAIIGPSGSGKSTLLNIIAGLIKPTAGEIVINGRIGYMFQKDHLLEWRNIWKNVLIGLEIQGQNNIKNQQKALDMLAKYGLSEFKHHFPKELSGGMKQRIALIRTLAIEPQMLLLDEPFSSLDFQTRLNVCDDVYQMIRNEKMTTVLVTHDLSEAISMADRIIVISNRPATILDILEINLTIEGERSPLKCRTAVEFRQYFDTLWRLINDEGEEDDL